MGKAKLKLLDYQETLTKITKNKPLLSLYN